MAAKLKNLKIRRVDFVDEGANPDAHIRMIKRKDGGVGADDKKESGDVLKKLLGFIGKAAGMDQSEIDSAVDEIQKSDSMSFKEKIWEFNNRKIADEMWDICYALQSALCSILNDEEMDSTKAAAAMQESINEFYAVAREAVPEWSGGRAAGIVRKKEDVSERDVEIMKAAVERLNDSIEKATGDAKAEGGFKSNGADNNGQTEGDKEGMGMKIDKSRLTDAERAFLDSIEKRYGTEEEAVSVPQAEESDSIYKGLHPAVRAELEGLKKFREEAEAREIAEVAKKYAVIGKKEDELVPLFKSLRAAGGTAYNDMIAILDQTVAAVEKSGVFSEIGKSGHGSGTAGAAEAKIEGIAKGYMEKDSSLDYASAVAKAWEDNPELMDEYEAEAGF